MREKNLIELTEKGEKIPYFKPENDEDQNIIFTASSDQWFSLLKKYNNDQKLFSDEDKLVVESFGFDLRKVERDEDDLFWDDE